MANESRLREVAWQELFPWTRIASAIRVAVSPSALVLAALGLVAMAGGWRAIGLLYRNSEDSRVQAIVQDVQFWPWQKALLPTQPVPDDGDEIRPSPFFYAWNRLSEPFESLFAQPMSLQAFSMILLMALWALLVWSLFGAGITRIAALALTRGDRMGFRAGLGWGVRRWMSYASGPLIPLIGVFILALPLLVFGLLMKLDFAVMLLSIIWPVALVLGFLMAMLLVGLFFGWPLMWATVGVESTDAFDSLSRAYSYVFHRPLRLLFYVIVAAVLGILAWIVVSLFYELTVNLPLWGISWGAGDARTEEVANYAGEVIGGPRVREEWNMFSVGAAVIGFWTAVAKTLAWGFVFAYFWSAATAIYLLLRKVEDGTEINEVTLDDDREQFGLPPLKNDGLGVPAVTDVPPPSAPRTPPPPPAQPPLTG
jgi:hypothetical protein